MFTPNTLFIGQAHNPFISQNVRSPPEHWTSTRSMYIAIFSHLTYITVKTSVCIHTECIGRFISVFWWCGCKNLLQDQRKSFIFFTDTMHCLALMIHLYIKLRFILFLSHFTTAPLADCVMWLENFTFHIRPVEVQISYPHSHTLKVYYGDSGDQYNKEKETDHIKPHYSEWAFDSALLAMWLNTLLIGS